MNTIVLAVLFCFVYVGTISAARIRNAEDEPYAKYASAFTELSDKDRTAEARIDVVPSHLTYYLYTRANANNPYIVSNNDASQLAQSANFNPQNRVIFSIHGWQDGYQADLNTQVTAAVLQQYDYNVIVVDWSPVANELYLAAKDGTVDVGRYIGDFINSLTSLYGISGASITIIGHSLGAHVAGIAGSRSNSQISHIVGLDPAGPFYNLDELSARLDTTDAKLVEIIHTATNFLGVSTSIGHIDHYPNGGGSQPGCGLDVLGGCSHCRSYEFLAEAIADAPSFRSTQCDSFDNFKKNKCASNRSIYLGLFQNGNAATLQGDYFFETNKKSPFSII